MTIKITLAAVVSVEAVSVALTGKEARIGDKYLKPKEITHQIVYRLDLETGEMLPLSVDGRPILQLP